MDLEQKNSDGWSPNGVLGGISAERTPVARDTLPLLMTPDQMADVNWTEGGTVPGPTPRPPHVTAAQGGDADALTRHIQSLDSRLSPLLGQQHWVAVPHAVNQDETARMDFSERPRGYDSAGADPALRYRDLEGTYVDRAHDARDPHIIAATGPTRMRSGSFDTPFHETGHGIDETPDVPSKSGRLNGPRSKEKAFMDAYGSDRSLWKLGADDYYFKDERSGPSEAFAESFARYFGGNAQLQKNWPGMYKYWADQYPNPVLGNYWK